MELDLDAKWRSVVTDLVVVGVLIVIAFLVRRHGLPTQGLWLDDAEEGAARKASPSQLIMVGRDHPGYVAALMGWSRLTGGSDASLAYPALIAGVLGPALLYVMLRVLGYAWWIGLLLGAALVASQTDIIYSGRLKPDTTDVLVVLILSYSLRDSPEPGGAGRRQSSGSWQPFCFHPTASSHSSRWLLRDWCCLFIRPRISSFAVWPLEYRLRPPAPSAW